MLWIRRADSVRFSAALQVVEFLKHRFKSLQMLHAIGSFKAKVRCARFRHLFRAGELHLSAAAAAALGLPRGDSAYRR